MIPRVVVVERDRTSANAARRAVEQLGYSVTAVICSDEPEVGARAYAPADILLMAQSLHENSGWAKAGDVWRMYGQLPVVCLVPGTGTRAVERAVLSLRFDVVAQPIDARELQIALDVTFHRHVLERKLAALQHWHHTSLRCVRDAVITTDASGRVTFLNPVAEALTGWRICDALGQPVGEVARLVDAQTRQPIESPVTVLLAHASAGLVEPLLLLAKDGTHA